MSQLVDWQIAKLHSDLADGLLSPWDLDMLQPNTVDVKLGDQFDGANGKLLSPDRMMWDGRGRFVFLAPNEFVLGHTVERFSIPEDICARIEGKSTWGRRGLLVHASAGFIDSGFTGQLTLELKNLTDAPIKLLISKPIAQVSFHRLDAIPSRKYGECGNHYQGQMGATPAAS